MVVRGEAAAGRLAATSSPLPCHGRHLSCIPISALATHWPLAEDDQLTPQSLLCGRQRSALAQPWHSRRTAATTAALLTTRSGSAYLLETWTHGADSLGSLGSRSSRAIETRGILSRAVLRPRSTASNHYPPVLPPAVQHDGRAAVRAVSRSLTPVAVVLILHSGSSSPPQEECSPKLLFSLTRAFAPSLTVVALASGYARAAGDRQLPPGQAGSQDPLRSSWRKTGRLLQG